MQQTVCVCLWVSEWTVSTHLHHLHCVGTWPLLCATGCFIAVEMSHKHISILILSPIHVYLWYFLCFVKLFLCIVVWEWIYTDFSAIQQEVTSGEEDSEQHIFLVILFTLWLILYISFCFISLLVCFLSLSSFLVRHFFLMSLPCLSSRWFSPILPFPRLSVGLHRPSCLSLSSGSPSSQSLYVWLPQWHLLYTPLPAFGSGEDTTADPAEQCQARVCAHTFTQIHSENISPACTSDMCTSPCLWFYPFFLSPSLFLTLTHSHTHTKHKRTKSSGSASLNLLVWPIWGS